MATQTQLSLKLLIDNKSKKVLFAEAHKDVVDFLFILLAIPVGTVIKLLAKEGMVGSIGSIYKSIETLDETYILSSQTKSALLNPITALPSKNTLFMTEGFLSATVNKYYRCRCHSYDACRSYYTDVYGTQCPRCGTGLTTEMQYVKKNVVPAAAGESAGVVTDVVTYTVKDDLTVMPMSTISNITVLNNFNVKNVGSLIEKDVNLGMEEGLKLLKASLQSKTVLTDVFIGKKRGWKAGFHAVKKLLRMKGDGRQGCSES